MGWCMVYNKMKTLIIVLCVAACAWGMEFGIDIEHYSRWCFNEFIGRRVSLYRRGDSLPF